MKDKTLEIIEKHLDDDFITYPLAPNITTLKDIDDLEKTLQVKFPEEYVAHLLGEGAEILKERGLSTEAKETVWPRSKVGEVGPLWTNLYCVHTYTASKESADWMRLEVQGLKFMEETGIKAVPILSIPGDQFIFCIDENGIIVEYDPEENKIEPMNMNFWELYDEELRQLKERKEDIKKLL